MFVRVLDARIKTSVTVVEQATAVFAQRQEPTKLLVMANEIKPLPKEPMSSAEDRHTQEDDFNANDAILVPMSRLSDQIGGDDNRNPSTQTNAELQSSSLAKSTKVQQHDEEPDEDSDEDSSDTGEYINPELPASIQGELHELLRRKRKPYNPEEDEATPNWQSFSP